MMQWFVKHALSTPKDASDPRIALLKVQNLKGLPAATVINAQIDPLRSEGEAFAKRLSEAGVTVRQRTFDGVVHEFFGMGAVVDKAKEAVQYAAEGLKTGFAAKK